MHTDARLLSIKNFNIEDDFILLEDWVEFSGADRV